MMQDSDSEEFLSILIDLTGLGRFLIGGEPAQGTKARENMRLFGKSKQAEKKTVSTPHEAIQKLKDAEEVIKYVQDFFTF